MDATTADARRLALHLSGQAPAANRDLVVLEAGLGASGRSWARVAELLAPHVTVAAYDRAGYGSSDPARVRRDLQALASDLDAVVAALPHARVALVGHSWGGPIVRVWADRLLTGRAHGTSPDRLAALVLVDPSDERAALYFSRAMRWSSGVQNALFPPLARTGLLRVANRAVLRALPEPHRSSAAADAGTRAAADAIVAENREVTRGLARLRDHPPVLGDAHVTIVSGGRSTRFDRALRAQLVAAHRASAAALGRGRHVVSATSGHMIPLEDPRVVADEVLALLRPDAHTTRTDSNDAN